AASEWGPSTRWCRGRARDPHLPGIHHQRQWQIAHPLAVGNAGPERRAWSGALWHLVQYRFFFSSRRRHTRFDCDWSSDVCSSDLTHTIPKKHFPNLKNHPFLTSTFATESTFSILHPYKDL